MPPKAPKITVHLNAYSVYRVWSLGESVPDRISRSFPNVRVVQSRDREAFLRLLPEANVLYTWSLPRRHFVRARQLKWVHTPESGVESLLFPELVKSPVQLTNSRGISDDSIADHAMALIYSLSRRLAECRDAQRQRIWARDLLWSGDRVPFALAGRTLLIVGLGTSGAALARRARAAGMPVIGVRRRMDQPPIPEVDEMHPMDDLESLLPRADVVVLALPATPATRGLLSAARVARLKPGMLLVNIGRGSLVDETALAEALASGRVGGAALDVCAEEPLPREHPFWGHPRVVITPHVAGTDPSHMDRATELFEKNLARFLEGQPLDNLVDKGAGY